MKKTLILIFLIQSYLTSAQNWEQVQSVPDGYRTDHSYAFSIDGTGYMVSGNTAAGFTADFYTYDPIADQWSKKDDFPGFPRGFAIGDVVDGKAYFGFGNNGSSNLNDFWEYDPVTDAWTELASCDCPARTHPAMVALDGFVYVGLGGGGGNKKDWWAYDIANDSWEQRADFPAQRRHHPYQFHDGEYIYVGNGHGDNTAEGLFISNEWYRYDTANDTWDQVATMPAEGRVAGTQLSHKGFGYVLSGDGDNHNFMETGELWKYDPEIDSWVSLPPHPGRSRWAPASFIINDEMYIINGWNSADGFLDEVYKLNLNVFDEARLRIMLPKYDDLLFVRSDGNCDAVAETEIEINTPLVFESDVAVTLSVDPSSTAVEGRDYIISDLEAIIPTGELSTTIGLTLFNDQVVSGDKTLIINLAADEVVEVPQATLVMVEDDVIFDTSVSNSSASVGIANTVNPNIFGQYYTNMITQFVYRRNILEESGLDAGPISQISMEVQSKESSLPYLNFTVYMANSAADALSGGINQTIDFQEVYRGTFSTVLGTNEIVFDTPFEYDGTSNLAMQICFDNNNYTLDDLVSAFDVNYNSTATLKIDNVNGCPNNGNEFNTTSLPVITFGEGVAKQLFSSLDSPLSSTITDTEDVFLSRNDSIFMEVSSLGSFMPDCFSASLLTNTNEIIAENGNVYQDRIYYLENESEDIGYNVTLILPNTGEVDWNSSDLVGLYSEGKLANGDTPSWETLEVIEVIENEPYTFVTVEYNGTGSYAVGGSDAITSVDDLGVEFIYDAIEYRDIMGREVRINENVSAANVTGIFIKSYLYKGRVVKSEKIVR